jgi:hypothetical protein
MSSPTSDLLVASVTSESNEAEDRARRVNELKDRYNN